MPVTARTCLHCGTRHWSTQPCPAGDDPKVERAKKAITAVTIKLPENVTIKDDTQSNTKSKPVTKSKKGGKRPGAGRKPIGDWPMTQAGALPSI